MQQPSQIDGAVRVWIIRAAMTAALVAGGYLAFELGRIQADYYIVDAVRERQDFRKEIANLENEIVELNQEIALLKTHRDIEREAYDEVEASLTELQRKIQEQRDAIAFYRGIISPADGGRGLRVQDLKLTKGKEERQYNVRLVLVQVMQHDRSVKGEVDFSIAGDQDGVETTYTLNELLPDGAASDWPFSFRYFQDFDRQVILPEGFLPERIDIEVRSRTKSIASVKQSYLWESSQG